MNTYIKMAIGILEQADRKEMTVPERRLYDAAMESYRYLPRAELLHDVEETADKINFRRQIEACGDDYVDFLVCAGRTNVMAHLTVAKWIKAGWDAELIEKQTLSPITRAKIPVNIIRVKRKQCTGGKEG